MQLDEECSRVRIGGRWFNACAFVCPNAPGQDDSEVERLIYDGELGTDQWECLVPLENGALMHVSESQARGIEAELLAETCTLFYVPASEDDPLYLPISVSLVDDHVRLAIAGVDTWRGCEEEWLAWHIERVASLDYDEPPGERGRVVSLVEARLLDAN